MLRYQYGKTELNFMQRLDVDKLLTTVKGDRLVIPEKINGMAVEGVLSGAFQGIVGIKEIVFPESVVYVLYGAINNCDVEALIFGKNLKNIDEGGLRTNKSLKRIEIEEGNPYYKVIQGNLYGANGLCLSYGFNNSIAANTAVIGANAFSNSDIESIVIPESVGSINNCAFMKCTKLKEVQFVGQGIVEIGNSSFMMCKKLKHIEIPGSVQVIGEYAFKGAGLTDLNFGDRGEKNLELVIDLKAFMGTKLTTLDLSNVKNLLIKSQAFRKAIVTNLTLSGKICLQPYAFYQCNIESISVKSISIEQLSPSLELLGNNSIGIVKLLEEINNKNMEATYILHGNAWMEDRFW